MKKILLTLTSLALLVPLTACGQFVDQESESTHTATLTVTFEDKATTTEVTFEEGDSVLDILEESHDVEEDGGMVTAIDGVSQDASTNTYWMYDVNGELAPKGVKEQLVAEGDQIDFYLETFE